MASVAAALDVALVAGSKVIRVATDHILHILGFAILFLLFLAHGAVVAAPIVDHLAGTGNNEMRIDWGRTLRDWKTMRRAALIACVTLLPVSLFELYKQAGPLYNSIDGYKYDYDFLEWAGFFLKVSSEVLVVLILLRGCFSLLREIREANLGKP